MDANSPPQTHIAFELLDRAQEWSDLFASIELPVWILPVSLFFFFTILLLAFRYVFSAVLSGRKQKMLESELKAALARIQALESQLEELGSEVDALWDELDTKPAPSHQSSLLQAVHGSSVESSRDRFQLNP